MTKIFSKPDTLLSIDGFIYLVDKTLNHREGVCVCLDEIRSNTEHGVKLGDKMYVDPIVYKSDNCGGCVRIIATNNPSIEGVAKIELPDEVEELAHNTVKASQNINTKREYQIAFTAWYDGYKAASSKKKYTEDEAEMAFKEGYNLCLSKHFHLLDGKIHPDEVPFETPAMDFEEYSQSLKPIPISIEIEVETIIDWENYVSIGMKAASHKEKQQPKLKDGYVIIKEVKYG